MERLTREGAALTEKQAATFEETLDKFPSDPTIRTELLGFYSAPSSESLGAAVRIQARSRHVLWLVRNHP